MKRMVLLSVVFLLGVIGYLIFFKAAPRQATLLLVNGHIYTLDERAPLVEALAITDGIIAAVGSTADIERKFKSTRILDLGGLPVYPGLIDAHAHMEGLGAAMMSLGLGGTGSVEEIQSLVAERARNTESQIWIRGRGWDQNLWPDKSFPTYHMLDAVSGDVPVYLTRVDGHAVWVNKKVLDIAGITKATPDPEGGKIIRDKLGNPTGVFIDNAKGLLNSYLPPVSIEERTRAVQLAVQECLRVGLTGVHDMGVDLDGVSIYKKLIDTGKFPFRVYAAVESGTEAWKLYRRRGPEIGYGGGRLSIRAVKLYADGALGSRGAAMIEPYSDDPGNRGLTLTSPGEIDSVVHQALGAGFQVCTHAIGDRGNHIVLDAYQKGLNSLNYMDKDVRFRVEHAQIVEPKDIPRFSSLGIIPSMQPAHCTSDMYWAGDRLGPDRLAGAYAWRSFLEHGSIVPAGSDFPVESANPLWGFYAAITRKDHSGWPDGGWRPEQIMTRSEALKAFTLWAAYAAFEERQKGTIEEGKLADLVVLSDDIMEVVPERILKTSVRYTIVGGDVVYSADSSSVR